MQVNLLRLILWSQLVCLSVSICLPLSLFFLLLSLSLTSHPLEPEWTRFLPTCEQIEGALAACQRRSFYCAMAGHSARSHCILQPTTRPYWTFQRRADVAYRRGCSPKRRASRRQQLQQKCKTCVPREEKYYSITGQCGNQIWPKGRPSSITGAVKTCALFSSRMLSTHLEENTFCSYFKPNAHLFFRLSCTCFFDFLD